MRNSLSGYRNTILTYDLINKYQLFNLNNLTEFSYNPKKHPLVVILKLATVKNSTIELKKLLSILLALEIVLLKKRFFNPHFSVTVTNGNYFLIKLELRGKRVDLFLLKLTWLFFPRIQKTFTEDDSYMLKLQKVRNGKTLFFKLSVLEQLEKNLTVFIGYKVFLKFSDKAFFLLDALKLKNSGRFRGE